MSPDDSQNCGKSKAPAGELRREKGIKNFCHGFFVHPTACILNLQANVEPRAEGLAREPLFVLSLLHLNQSRADRYGAWTVAARLRCVDDQVHRELLDLSGINFYSGKAVSQVKIERDFLRDGGREMVSGLQDVFRERDGRISKLALPA